MKSACPRMMIAAPSSGSGKTVITCGILQALVNRKMNVASFKCGPDYIDPMFHSRVIGARSKNLDTFFTDPDTTRYLFGKTASECDISVIEGVMGFYDGLGGKSIVSSSYELSETLASPVILIVDCYGAATTVAAVIKGLKEFRNNNIAGVILNRMSASIFESIKELIEEEVNVKVLGYIPTIKDIGIESRHLGLVLPDEIASLKEDLNRFAAILEETVNIDAIIDLAGKAAPFDFISPEHPCPKRKVRIAVAEDEAFCFTYEDNLDLLRSMGAKIVAFSPMKDDHLPKVDGMILSGGYPELHAEALSKNRTMIDDIRNAITSGMPCIAECGGFMYLNEEMEDANGISKVMTGVLKGKCFRTEKLVRFGYITLKAKKDCLLLKKGESIKAHEFHYWDCTDNRDDCTATKAFDDRTYDCSVANDRMFAGFPHVYFYSNPDAAYSFMEKCCEYKEEMNG